MEELRLNKDERFTAMVEGRWDEFGADLPEVFRARIDATVADIVERFPGKRVAAVCHGGVINVALGSVLGVEQPLWFEPGLHVALANAGLALRDPVDRKPQRARAPHRDAKRPSCSVQQRLDRDHRHAERARERGRCRTARH